MSGPFARGKRARGICDRCGFAYKLDQLKTEVVKGRRTGSLICETCFDPDHPQLHLGTLPIYDPQALENPRPDFAEFAQSRAVIVHLRGVQATSFAGEIEVSTP